MNKCPAQSLHGEIRYGNVPELARTNCPLEPVGCANYSSYDHLHWCSKCGALVTEAMPEGPGENKPRMFFVKVTVFGNAGER